MLGREVWSGGKSKFGRGAQTIHRPSGSVIDAPRGATTAMLPGAPAESTAHGGRGAVIHAAGPAQDPGEPFDVVLADGTPTGRVKSRAAIHRDGDWHRAVHVWVAGVDAGSPFLTFQRRSPRKDTWPNRYDATVGGHYRAGETLRDTLREIEEEIGIAPDPRSLRTLGVRVCANEAERGIVDRELQDVFLLRDDRPLTTFRPNPAELAALARFPLDTLLPFLAGETGDVCGAAITPEAATPRPITARREDFIPTVDRYFLRAAIAARNLLRGDDYVTI
jgi:isopentenyldiphosphate isomerase